MVTKCTEALFFCVYPSHCSKRSVEAVSRKSPFSESFPSPLMCTCHIYHFLWWATVLACSRSLIWLFVQNFSGIRQSSWGSSCQAARNPGHITITHAAWHWADFVGASWAYTASLTPTGGAGWVTLCLLRECPVADAQHILSISDSLRCSDLCLKNIWNP